MKYKIKLRRTVVQETYTEVDSDDVVSAMDKAEQKMFFYGSLPTTSPDVSTHETEWVAVSVTTEE